MEKTQQRALYPWETPRGEQPIGCGQPLEDSTAFPAEPDISPGKATASAGTTLPAAPAYVLAHAFQDCQVTLLWGEASGADGYLILRGGSQGAMKPVAAVEQASYIDSRVCPGKTYYYAVRAYNEQGQSAATLAAAVSLPAVPEPEAGPEPASARSSDAFAGKRLRVQKKPQNGANTKAEPIEERSTAPGAPDAPTNLHASIRGTHLVELQWQGDALEGTEYRLYRSATPWCSYGLTAETKECRFLDTVPEAGTKYYYFAQAVREGRSSGASAMVQALTFPGLPPPEPPGRLRAAPVNPDAVELRWPHARGAAAYAVYARMEGEDFQVVGHTLDGGYLHEGLPPDVRVDYRVQSYHDTGVSEPSAICTVSTGAQPTMRTGAQRPPANNAPRPARPAPPQNRRFPVFSLQGLQNPLIK